MTFAGNEPVRAKWKVIGQVNTSIYLGYEMP